MKTSSPRRAAFTLIEIMIVVAIIAILVAVAVPVFIKARESSQKNTCISNLRLMDSAITAWALEAKKGIGDGIDQTALFGPDNLMREKPVCPAGGDFDFRQVGIMPQVTCTYSDLGHVLP